MASKKGGVFHQAVGSSTLSTPVGWQPQNIDINLEEKMTCRHHKRTPKKSVRERRTAVSD
jgi:hypothetical protein